MLSGNWFIPIDQMNEMNAVHIYELGLLKIAGMLNWHDQVEEMITVHFCQCRTSWQVSGSDNQVTYISVVFMQNIWCSSKSSSIECSTSFDKVDKELQLLAVSQSQHQYYLILQFLNITQYYQNAQYYSILLILLNITILLYISHITWLALICSSFMHFIITLCF